MLIFFLFFFFLLGVGGGGGELSPSQWLAGGARADAQVVRGAGGADTDRPSLGAVASNALTEFPPSAAGSGGHLRSPAVGSVHAEVEPVGEAQPLDVR